MEPSSEEIDEAALAIYIYDGHYSSPGGGSEIWGAEDENTRHFYRGMALAALRAARDIKKPQSFDRGKSEQSQGSLTSQNVNDR